MPDLASFQRDFASALLADGQATASFRSQAFAVYRNTCARGVVEGLRASFPTVDMLVGEEMFTAVALDFRGEQPPAGPVLSDYGREFPAFLAKQPWTSELPYLADVARLDWLWLESFLASDLPPAPRTLGTISRVTLHPATRIAWLATPAMTIWLAHRGSPHKVALDLDWEQEGALFTRAARCVRAERVDAAFHHLLLTCAAPASVAEIVSAVANVFPDSNVPELLQQGVASGALIIQ